MLVNSSLTPLMSMSSAPITGHCLCGNISYIVDASPEGTAICHCEDCRRSTGAANSLVIVVPREFFTVKGDYREYTTTALSGQVARRIFCPNCGAQIANLPDSNKSVAYIKAGTLAEDIQKALVPNIEVFTRDRLPYIQDRFGVQFETSAG